MILNYSETNKKLSMIAAILLVLAGILDVFGMGIYRIVTLFLAKGNIWGVIINSLKDIVFWLCQMGIAAALIMRKKNVVSAITCALPLVCAVIISPVLDVIRMILFGGFYPLSWLTDAVFYLPLILFSAALAFNCFTKGKMFGEKAGFALLILGVLTYLAAVLYPIADALTDTLNYGVRSFTLWLRILLRSLDLDLSLITAAPTILVALAFSRPNQELIPEETENNINEEENEE